MPSGRGRSPATRARPPGAVGTPRGHKGRAATQEQLDIYGDLFDTAWVYAERGGTIDRETGRELARVADFVCDIWRRPDRGIWEVRMEPQHFTHSKAMCWVALDRAQRLAARGQLPGDTRAHWAEEAAAIRVFI